MNSEFGRYPEGAQDFSFEKEEEDFVERKINVNGKDVTLVGVAHDMGTFEKNKKRIEDLVNSATSVVLEYAPEASGMLSEESLDKFIEMGVEAGYPRLTREEMKYNLLHNDGVYFFRAIEELAKKHGKPIVTVDPVSSRSGVENMHAHEDLKDVDSKLRIAGFVIGSAGFASLANDIFKQFEKPSEDEARSSEKKSSGGLSRRSFLKGMVGAVGLAATTTIGARNPETSKNLVTRIENNPLGPALYDGVDYRDVVVAEGLDVVTKDVSTQNIVAFMGKGHSGSVEHYVKNTQERDVKRAMYALYEAVIDPQLRVYRYDGKTGQWLKEQESNI